MASVANYRARAQAVHTNAPPSGAFRGFGVPQAAIAQECLFDELSDRLEQWLGEAGRTYGAMASGAVALCLIRK